MDIRNFTIPYLREYKRKNHQYILNRKITRASRFSIYYASKFGKGYNGICRSGWKENKSTLSLLAAATDMSGQSIRTALLKPEHIAK
jgi:hypothetical protein